MEIVQVQNSAEIEEIRRLFDEYWSSFGFTPCFQNFSGELYIRA